MAVENKRVKEFEDKSREVLFGKVEEISSQQRELISGIEKSGKFVDLEGDLPNIGITLNNKLVELQHEFQNAGISMYSKKVEDYGLLKLNYVDSSFVGDAVILDLINYASKGVQNLADYSKMMKKVTDKKVEKVQALEKASPIRRFFAEIRRFLAEIRSFFVPVKQEDMTYTPEETESINSHLRDYRETDKELWKYNLRDNIIPSIVKQIRDRGYSAYIVPGLLEEGVIPDLEKLGLVDLIPQLQQTLIEEYKKDLLDPEKHQVNDKDLYRYVPDFTRESKRGGKVDLGELSRQVNSMRANIEGAIKGGGKSLRQHGISLMDLSLVDKDSNPSDRQAAISAIKEELHPVQEVNQCEKHKVTEISLDD